MIAKVTRVATGAIFGAYVMNTLRNEANSVKNENACNKGKDVKELFQVIDDYVEQA